MINKLSILLIGSTGFLGRAALEKLSDESMDIWLLSRNFIDDNSVTRLSTGEIGQISNHYDFVINLAACIPYGHLDNISTDLFETNTILPYRLSQLFPSSHHVFASTVSVYGSHEKSIITETTPTNTMNAYGASKLAGECLTQTVTKSTILRFSSLYGRGMSNRTLIPKLIEMARAGKPLTLWGDGQRKQDYLHVRDAADLILKVIKGPKTGVYNAVSSKSISNLELAKTVTSFFPGSKINFSGKDLTPSLFYSGNKSLKTFQFSPHISLKEGLGEIIHHGA